MSKIIVFGASGQLGQCLKKVAETEAIDAIFFPAETAANILDIDAIRKIFATHKPAWCINCAAYTAVDKAEDDIELARKVNKTGVENLSNICLEYDTVFIHTSTDFVFKGDKASPLIETDATEPINVYGLTKLEGEQAITRILEKYYIIRTSWLYSECGNNFVKTMLKLGTERDELKVIADQAGTPTYAMDLASAIFKIISSENTHYGIYDYSNQGIASWYDFARAIFDIAGTQVKVVPVKTSEYITKAVRPAYSVMEKSKIKQTFNISIPYWRDSLITCISKL